MATIDPFDISAGDKTRRRDWLLAGVYAGENKIMHDATYIEAVSEAHRRFGDDEPVRVRPFPPKFSMGLTIEQINMRRKAKFERLQDEAGEKLCFWCWFAWGTSEHRCQWCGTSKAGRSTWQGD